MRVCLIAYKFYESDPRMLQFASAFSTRGEVVDVISLRRKGQSFFEIMDGVRVHRVQFRIVDEQGPICHVFRMLRFLFAAAIVVSKNQLKQKYDAVHVLSVPDCLVLAAFVPKFMGTPVILDVYDILPEFYASKYGIQRDSTVFRLLLLVERYSIAFSSHTTVANKIWWERLTSRSTTVDKCTTVDTYPSSSLFFVRPKERTDGKFILIYPGTLNRHQGVDIAVRAVAIIASRIPELEFHIYGEGPTKAFLTNLVDELSLQRKVVFHDLLPTKKVVPFMADSDLGVVAKRASSEFGNEAASSKIGEFMALGVPVVASRTKIDSLYYADSQLKFFESENEQDLADSILLLYQDVQLRTQLVDNAAKYIQDNNWEMRKHEYLELVDSLVQKQRSCKTGEQSVQARLG